MRTVARVLKDVRDAFAGDGDLTERQGSTLVVGAGVMFSLTAIAVAAVIGDRLIEADRTTLRISDDTGGPGSEFVLRELGPVASIVP